MLRRTAHALADAAREAILPHFRAFDLQTENKLEDEFDPVTIADRAAEQAMRDILAKDRPKDAILGEEFGHLKGQSGLTWVLDPIDGTRGFIAGTPTWGVLIAICDDSGPLYGIIDQPYIGERFEGGFGHATMLGPHGSKKLRTKVGFDLAQSIIFTTFPEIGTKIDQAAFHAVAKTCKLTRYGMDCYAYALLAAGQIDLVIEAGLQSYDIAAPIAVIQAAGGIVTDWTGGSAYRGGRVIAAASAQQHAEALEIMQQFDLD
ncbi:histidinol-phosphatase [Parasulfitobacter algicola]|uniref:Histidinol-phosphatase n=1 Tax=Parasulfitobacter algicola TaxID=2614809 RepID=A0ABX2IUE7_9RHOB|nr:histidinol-phosphatase [Sulfitobacter algicola]NSX56506.1 histidinol-phosphatase [Sulfitobacter algicola]